MTCTRKNGETCGITHKTRREAYKHIEELDQQERQAAKDYQNYLVAINYPYRSKRELLLWRLKL